ncbi:hypothetical protein DFR76_11570 [Nocardia pseudobrasiliensis]|uniref:Uncharacterized protein n=1 Tax=Nocardia pseudobrasiliensis TaxID=45979 RepID=A0A370HQ42_9NOCA|nr:hypothetical protein DFR76_11570 [Nocardia pseudobrasiliensis]
MIAIVVMGIANRAPMINQRERMIACDSRP